MQITSGLYISTKVLSWDILLTIDVEFIRAIFRMLDMEEVGSGEKKDFWGYFE